MRIVVVNGVVFGPPFLRCVFFTFCYRKRARSLATAFVCYLSVSWKKNVRCAIRKSNATMFPLIESLCLSHRIMERNIISNKMIFLFVLSPIARKFVVWWLWVLLRKCVQCSLWTAYMARECRKKEQHGNLFHINTNAHTHIYTKIHNQSGVHNAEAADEESNASTFNLLFYFIFFLPECATKMWERSEKKTRKNRFFSKCECSRKMNSKQTNAPHAPIYLLSSDQYTYRVFHVERLAIWRWGQFSSIFAIGFHCFQISCCLVVDEWFYTHMNTNWYWWNVCNKTIPKQRDSILFSKKHLRTNYGIDSQFDLICDLIESNCAINEKCARLDTDSLKYSVWFDFQNRLDLILFILPNVKYKAH